MTGPEQEIKKALPKAYYETNNGPEELGLQPANQIDGQEFRKTIMLIVIALLLWLVTYTVAITLSTCIDSVKSLTTTSSYYYTFAFLKYTNGSVVEDQITIEKF